MEPRNKVTVERRHPSECTPQELASFASLIRNAGEVEASGLNQRIRRAKSLTFLRDGDKMIGVAALKIPDATYKRRVFANAGVPLSEPGYPYELGWIAVDPLYQGKGLSRSLVESALAAADESEVFATSHSDNSPMHKTLARFGFRRVGAPYSSSRPDRTLILFVRASDHSAIEPT
jgi:GNAT superfamily N-acetyltransferase